MRALVHYFRVRFAVLPLIEVLVLVQSMVIGYAFGLGSVDPSVAPVALGPTLHGLLFAGVMLLSMTALGLYAETAETFRLTVQRIFGAYLITLLVLSGVFYLLPNSTVGRGVVAVA